MKCVSSRQWQQTCTVSLTSEHLISWISVKLNGCNVCGALTGETRWTRLQINKNLLVLQVLVTLMLQTDCKWLQVSNKLKTRRSNYSWLPKQSCIRHRINTKKPNVMRYFPEIVTEFIFTSRHLSQPVSNESTEDTVVLVSRPRQTQHGSNHPNIIFKKKDLTAENMNTLPNTLWIKRLMIKDGRQKNIHHISFTYKSRNSERASSSETFLSSHVNPILSFCSKIISLNNPLKDVCVGFRIIYQQE